MFGKKLTKDNAKQLRAERPPVDVDAELAALDTALSGEPAVEPAPSDELGKDGPHTPITYLDNEGVLVGHHERGTAQNVRSSPQKGKAAMSAAEQMEAAEARQTQAQEELGQVQVTRGMKTLLERAMDNIGKNNGANLEDLGAKAKANAFATVTIACGYDFSLATQTLAEMETPTQMPGTIFSYCYTVLKAACFISNMDYRRALDAKGDLDLALYIDPRGDQRDAPLGLAAESPEVEPERLVMDALRDLQLFVTLVAESYGWQPRDIDGEPSGRLVPLAVLMTAEGKFESIFDVEQALDRQEVQRKIALAKRADRFAEMAARAKSVSADIVRRALAARSA